jgi:hypothetical protein
MQKVVADKAKNMVEPSKNKKEDAPKKAIDNIALFFEYLPSYEEYANNGEDCETSYHRCKLF